ncbi:hypothetical protein FisN_3Lh517 [Fistulifera solaris]|uniref:Fe2OG dioxygenase domain-containing protein n=1 Tax=Fistulifera solaris TaxID=1519565 RepID=A0A1Z5J8I7_FISSO|nr:hypothetical protein FisN_3Lh517 [Fistulifera solaris]|eukprot:GAX10314.1 hypothetical protein FisN_3Lh517 [Fistulifera solaris]
MLSFRIILFACALGWTPSYGQSSKRHVSILNDSTSLKAQVNWVHPQTGDRVPLSSESLRPGGEFPLDTFVGHELELQEIDCSPACRRTSFVVSERHPPVVRLVDNFELVWQDTLTKTTTTTTQAETLVQDCRQQAQQQPDPLNYLSQCVEQGMAAALEQIQQDIAFQTSVRTDIAHMLENYTCLDGSLESTPDVRQEQWQHKPGEPVLQVHVKHERPASRIHMIEDFIRPDECKAMEEAAAVTLHRATVADGKGGSRVSENRKAMQAGITVPWHLEVDDHPIARLSRRVYDYTNHVLGLNIDEFGQEDLMSIQYFGRGRNDTTPDRYTPHCDGDCTGQPHKSGTRMATLVMYCDVATDGGHTNFRNAGVHVKPTTGAGIFFSYIDPDTLVMDSGYTEHSGCPVFEGTKRIVTQWVRLGVDTENPWDSYNTLGIKKSLAEEE